MSDDEDPKKNEDSKKNDDPKTKGDFSGELRNYRTRTIPKNRPGFFGTHKTVLHDDLDKNCLYQFSNNFIRIEYPGRVENVDKAIETLGGMRQLELAAERKKLELVFNPTNQYNKGSVADSDTNVGLLIKVKRQSDGKCSYEILGPSRLNFKFNRMCDFQYLPLLAKNEPENEESEVEYIYDKIITSKIPSLDWFTKKEADNPPTFLIAENFARFDLPQAKFQLNSANTFISLLRPDIKASEYTNRTVRQSQTISSIRVSFLKPVANIPDQPLSSAMKLIKEKVLQKHYILVKSYFQERPIWRKPAIMHKSNISEDAAKFVLPGVAYYCSSGPWRSCWIRYGYDPTNDYNSRIYQILDFRIRTNEGMQLKIKTKRGSITTNILKTESGSRVCEADYIIRPNRLPPARQIFYQYCDILLPEIQEMVLKLPKLPAAAKYDPKNGWLPLSFQEHCREIVTKCIFDAIQQEVLKESQVQEKKKKNTENVSKYGSKILSNIRKGVHQSSMGEYSGGNVTNQENIIEEIDLLDDDDTEQIDANEVINSYLNRIPESFEDYDESDIEIDLETVEEVNEIVSGIKDQNRI